MVKAPVIKKETIKITIESSISVYADLYFDFLTLTMILLNFIQIIQKNINYFYNIYSNFLNSFNIQKSFFKIIKILIF